MKKCVMSILSMLIVMTLTMMLGACSGTDVLLPDPEQHAIAFASVQADEEAVTRAASTPLSRDFTVYGYKTVLESDQVVFDGYRVRYSAGSANTSLGNTHGYYYVYGEQTIKYWDLSASEYSFWAYTGNKADFSADNVLTISGIEQSVTEPDVAEQMFSAVYHRATVLTDVVRLQFLRPYAKVRVLFYSGQELGQGYEIELSDITFGPSLPQRIITNGDLTVTYPMSGLARESYSIDGSQFCDNLIFDNTVLDHTSGTSAANAVTIVPTGGTEFYYTVPYSYPVAFTLSALVDGAPKTAVVPATYMQWKPNYVYTYIFKIAQNGKRIDLYDVQIDPWHYGGSQVEEWKNW